MRIQTNFFKGIPGFSRATQRELAESAEDSIYFWWWSFARLSPALWYAKHSGVRPVDAQLAATVERIGDLENPSFGLWWRRTGQRVFEEARRPDQVRLVPVDESTAHTLYERSIVVEVPLTIRRETILTQFRRLLATHHHAQAEGLLDQSTAPFRLHTKRYRLQAVERSYLCLLYRLLYPKIAIWRIGDRLQIAPSIRVRGIERGVFDDRSGPFVRLHSLTGRYIYKAQYMLYHLERGAFPNTSSPPSNGTKRPFGAKHHQDFLDATRLDGKSPSPWSEWLDEKFSSNIRHEVVERNHLEERIRLPDSKARRALPAFIAGQTDELY